MLGSQGSGLLGRRKLAKVNPENVSVWARGEATAEARAEATAQPRASGLHFPESSGAGGQPLADLNSPGAPLPRPWTRPPPGGFIGAALRGGLHWPPSCR